MFPILLPLGGGIAIRSYGVMIAVALLLGAWWTRHRAAARGFSLSHADEIVTASVIGGLIGARLYYVLLTEPSWFLHRPLEIFAVWRGGLAVHGAWIGGALAALRAMRRRQVSFWRYADAVAPALALGQAIGRVGCFLSGCCFGLPTQRLWGVVFNHPETLAPRGIPLHPTQLYEAALALLIVAVLWWFEHRTLPDLHHQPHANGWSPAGMTPRCEGEVFLLYLLLSSVARFAVEALRWDNLYWWGTTLKMAQLVSVALVVTAAVCWVVRRKASIWRKA